MWDEERSKLLWISWCQQTALNSLLLRQRSHQQLCSFEIWQANSEPVPLVSQTKLALSCLVCCRIFCQKYGVLGTPHVREAEPGPLVRKMQWRTLRTGSLSSTGSSTGVSLSSTCWFSAGNEGTNHPLWFPERESPKPVHSQPGLVVIPCLAPSKPTVARRGLLWSPPVLEEEPTDCQLTAVSFFKKPVPKWNPGKWKDGPKPA